MGTNLYRLRGQKVSFSRVVSSGGGGGAGDGGGGGGGTPPTGDFTWSDSDAENYYNALFTANGNADIDSQSLYGIDLDTLKGGIEDRIVDAKASGYYSGGLYLFLFIGGTAATHAINAIDGSSVLTYSGSTSPVHDATGMVLDATNSQYADINNDFRNEIAGGDNWSMAVKATSSNSNIGMGSRDAAAIGAVIRWSTQTILGYCNESAFSGSIPTTHDHLISASRTAQNDARLYRDATEVASLTNFSTLSATPTTYSTLIGAWDNSGTGFITLSTGNFTFAWIGAGMSAGQVSDQVSHQAALDALLGR